MEAADNDERALSGDDRKRRNERRRRAAIMLSCMVQHLLLHVRAFGSYEQQQIFVLPALRPHL